MKLIRPHLASINTPLAKPTVMLVALIIASAAPIGFASRVLADQSSARIQALQAETRQAQAQAAVLHQQAATLQDALAKMASDQAVIQAQIDASQTKYNQLKAQIDATKQKIKLNQDALGSTIAQIYVDDKISPLEMIASSKNVADYIDKQEYRNSVRDELSGTIKTIKTLKELLNNQQIEVARALTDGQNARTDLAAKQTEQQTLLTQTNGQEAAYQQLAAGKQAETTQLINAQIAFNMKAAQRGGSQMLSSSGTGGYPGAWANASQDSIIDSWGLYNRECVSYVAWKIASTGRFVPNFNGQGNANQWQGYLSGYGIRSGSTPVVGSAAALSGGAYGHMMYVETVSADGSRITISEYNYGWSGRYSERSISSAGLTYLYF